jgi:hypothetical protein
MPAPEPQQIKTREKPGVTPKTKRGWLGNRLRPATADAALAERNLESTRRNSSVLT